jgi:hypothetical protein
VTALQKVTLNLRAGDFDKVRFAYPKLGAGKAIRIIVRKHIEQIEAKSNIPNMIKLEEALND